MEKPAPSAPDASPAGKTPSFPELKARFDADPLSLCWRIPGLWPVAKPPGPSSHRIVAGMRRLLGERRVGHAGTLDPAAEGLLLVMAGNASRLFDAVQEFPKTYVASFRLGLRTDSRDATGAPLADWPGRTRDIPGRDAMAAKLARFRGEIEQIPPMFSALKRNGVPLYRLARRGETVARAPRRVRVHFLSLDAVAGGSGTMTMRVSSGFYVRTLIDDWGVDLGCGAVMTRLVRTAIGPFTLEAARTLEAVAGLVSPSMPADAP